MEVIMRKILVSECLYGGSIVRYDGEDRAETDPRFIKWKSEGRLVKVCPEVYGGLTTPRSDAQRQKDGTVMTRSGHDVTEEYMKGAVKAVHLAEKYDVVFCIMKQKSPSCGSTYIYDGSFSGAKIHGEGLAVELLRKAGFIVFGEDQLDEAETALAAEDDADDK